jgi:hypothetical protein
MDLSYKDPTKKIKKEPASRKPGIPRWKPTPNPSPPKPKPTQISEKKPDPAAKTPTVTVDSTDFVQSRDQKIAFASNINPIEMRLKPS